VTRHEIVCAPKKKTRFYRHDKLAALQAAGGALVIFGVLLVSAKRSS